MEWLLNLDGNILLYIQEYVRQDFMTPFWKAVTSLGNGGWFWITLSLLLLIPKKTRWIGFTALLALLIGAIITNLGLKNLVARTRPYEVIDGLKLLIKKPSDYSFPSGHTCASFAAATVFLKKCKKRYGIPALILAIMIGFSRLYVGVHYPTDVLGGMLIGIFAGCVACWIVRKIQLKKYANIKYEEKNHPDKEDATKMKE